MRNENQSKEANPCAAGRESQAAEWQAKATRIDRLLVRMNYEIRTAVNVILGLTDLMREFEADGNLGSNMSAARNGAECLLEESERIIDLTRAELGSLQLCSVNFNLHDTLQQATDLMSILTVCKRIRLTTHISQELPLSVIGDSGRLSQILLTLLRAAIDQLEQGEITVSVQRDSSDAQGAKIRFSVAGNGQRIPIDRINRTFRGGLDRETVMKGGCDTARMLARHLARMMGGDLWAEVDSKAGSVFHFNVNLPMAPTVDFQQLCEAGPEIRAGQRPLKILVADDSEDTLRLIRALVKDAPWRIESADNGRTAVDMAVSKSYDLILMDLDMPEMDGYFAARQIRISECLNDTPAVPIVALTAHNEAEATFKSIQAGCTAHITKPIRRATLIEAIQRYAGNRRNTTIRH